MYEWVDDVRGGEGMWTQLRGGIDGEVGGDYFGYGLSFFSDGGTIVVGARMNGSGCGTARVYRLNDDVETDRWGH